MKNLFLRRLIITLIPVLIIASAFFIRGQLADQKEAPKKKPTPPTLIPKVQTLNIENKTVPSTIEVQGRLAAFEKMDIFAEVSGTLTNTGKPFKVGTYFEKDALLLNIDNEEAYLNLLSQKSTLMNVITQMLPDLKIDYPASFQNWKTYLDNFNVEHSIKAFPNPVNTQEKYYVASKNILSQYYNIKSAESRLSKYNVYAPFSGVITNAGITPGSLVRAGQKMGELMNTSNYELEATVAMSDLKYIKVGNTVRLTSDDVDGSWSGRVKRISNQLDANTQSIIVYIGVSGRNLREGMYLSGNLNASSFADAVAIPSDLIIDQNYVYVIKDSTLALQEINIVKTSESETIVKGLKEGTQVLNSKVSNPYEGMKVGIGQ